MIKRLLIVVLFVLTALPLLLFAPIIMLVMGIVGVVFKYIVGGCNSSELSDFILGPMDWIIDLPYKIIGRD